MSGRIVIGALSAVAVTFSLAAFAQGTAADAKAMLEKTVAAIKADKAKALEEINAGTSGFLVGDIYPFCFQLSDGTVVAISNPPGKVAIGKDVRTFKDVMQSVFGERLYAEAKEGQINEVSSKFPKPGTPQAGDIEALQFHAVDKVYFVTAVAGLGCGVSYYK